MTATNTPNVLADEWNECIYCGAPRSDRFFCDDCLSNRVDEELMQDNPILHHHEGNVARLAEALPA